MVSRDPGSSVGVVVRGSCGDRYEWTVENGAIPVPSMIGQAVLPVKQFLSYPPEILRNRLYADQHEAYAFCVVFQREGEGMVLNVTTPQVHKRKYWSPP